MAPSEGDKVSFPLSHSALLLPPSSDHLVILALKTARLPPEGVIPEGSQTRTQGGTPGLSGSHTLLPKMRDRLPLPAVPSALVAAPVHTGAPAWVEAVLCA